MPYESRERAITAKRLKECRNKKGLSHVGLEQALKKEYDIKISAAALKNYEVAALNEFHTKAEAVAGMNIKYLYTLADFYGVSTDYLLGLSDVPTSDTDVQRTCELTGLSPEALDELITANKGYGLGVVTWLFESKSIRELMASIFIYKRTLYRGLTRQYRKVLSFIERKGLKIAPEIVYQKGRECIPKEESTDFLHFDLVDDDGGLRLVDSDSGYALFKMQENVKNIAKELDPIILEDVIADMRSNNYREHYGLSADVDFLIKSLAKTKKGEQPNGNDNKAR